MAKRSENACRRSIKAGLVVGAVVLCAPIPSQAMNSVAPAAGAAKRDSPEARYSSGVADIVKMADAKVDAEVIKTYIKNSSTAYNPSATEIITLKDRGIGPEIITAMLQRGAEVRAQSARAGAATPAPAPQTSPAAVTPYAPAYDYGAQPVYPNYAYTYPVGSYVYPSYSYVYPYYGYGCSWPFYWPSFYFGGYPYRGYCGPRYCYSGYRYPYGYGGRGCGYYYGAGRYWGGGGYYASRGHYGGAGYYGGRAYYGARGYYGAGARSAPYAGQRASFHSFGSAGRPATFVGASSGFRGGGGFSSHAVSFSGRGGGFGGRSMGRGR